MNQKTILGSAAAIIVIAFLVQYSIRQDDTSSETVGFVEGDINVTLLNNAGVMIEVDDIRIYIDPIDLPQSYADDPADAILVTHDHGDHYQASTIDMLQKEGTVNVFPSAMRAEVIRHDAVGVVPEDEVMIGDIKVTPFYMYTFSVVPGQGATHPAETQYTSFIVDIGGFTIFHAGDTKNIPEFEELAGTINVAMLPLGPGCQTMADDEVVDALDVIDPEYFIPIHFMEDENDRFCSVYERTIETITDAEVCNLDQFTTRSFSIG